MARDDEIRSEARDEVESGEPRLRQGRCEKVGEPGMHLVPVDDVTCDQRLARRNPESRQVDRVATNVLEYLDRALLVTWEGEEREVVSGRNRGDGGDDARTVGGGPKLSLNSEGVSNSPVTCRANACLVESLILDSTHCLRRSVVLGVGEVFEKGLSAQIVIGMIMCCEGGQ